MVTLRIANRTPDNHPEGYECRAAEAGSYKRL
jgi:hypothetical protein